MARPTPTGSTPAIRAQAGFGFLTVLFLIILIGLALGQAGTVWSTQSTRLKEADLLWVGEQYRNALKAYYEAGNGAAKTWPHTLDDLILDPRQPTIRRYLRKRYPDPLTGKQDWGLISDPVTNEIRGVYSRAPGQPLKQSGFPKNEADFEKAKTYADWRFEAKAQDETAPSPGAPPALTPATPGGTTAASTASPTTPAK
jgi:type II secretory pathway pseudopilin PulG